MKKIKILLAVITVLTILSLGVFAADSSLVFEADTVEYTEGESLTISVYSTVDASIYKNGHFVLTFDMSVWEFDKEASEVVVAEEKLITDYSGEGYNEIEVVLSRSESIAVTANGKVADLVFNKKAGANAVGTVFEFADNSKWKTGSAASTKMPYSDSITVEAAGPVPTEKTEKAAVTVNANDITVGDVTYENVAVLEGIITLPTLKEGESITAAGIEYDSASVKTFTGLTGGGSITYRALFFGITDDEANALGAKVKTYYTGLFID